VTGARYLVLLAAAATATAGTKVPLYLWPGQTPFRTVEAQTDDAYRPGDLAAVAGRWQAGGLAGGAILLCSIKDPLVGEKNVLDEAPIDVRYFYLDVLPPTAPTEPGGFARAAGLVADEGLYEYGYVLRPQELEPLASPAFDEEKARDALGALRKKIKKIKLERITREAHRPYNKGYKIVADAAAAALEVENVDYERGWAVVRARLERLPPRESDVLFRYLDVYLVVDLPAAEVTWAVACVGGYYLE